MADDSHVNEAARLLLDRFRRSGEPETFTLLFELTQPQLARIAESLTRRLAPSVDPDDLVSGFFARQYTELHGPQQQPVRHFLGLANRSMRNAIVDQMRRQQRDERGIQDYQDTLPDPADPAREAEDQETDKHLSRYGDLIAELTGECFHGLEARDKHVLIAREILGFSYDRVATMLDLDADQVGMIIRRARQHLADRLSERLADADSGEMADEDIERTCQLVQRCLQSRERVKNVRTLVQRMLDASAATGRRRLADLVYELAKSCLLAMPELKSRMLVQRAPRQRAVVASDVASLSQRLSQVDTSLDRAAVEGLALRDAQGRDALDEARRCLEALATLEGESGRQRVAVALHLIYSDRLVEAEQLLRGLLDADLPSRTRQNVFRNLTLSLLRQDRWIDAAEVAEQSADEWPDDPVQTMNLCFAAARTEDVSRFEENVARLAALNGRNPSARVQSWIDGELPGLAHDLRLPPSRLSSLLSPPDEASSAGT